MKATGLDIGRPSPLAPALELEVAVAETMATIQGESSRAGFPCWVIRLAGCPLRCRWCDTDWARGETDAQRRTIGELVREAVDADLHHVLVTGGEPLAQSEAPTLLEELCQAGLLVALETSGAIPTDCVDERVRVVLDIKCPSSGMSDHIYWPNLSRLGPNDEVKMVVADRDDYLWALERIRNLELTERADVTLSPVTPQLDPQELARWILEDRLPVRLGLQLHKIAWSDLG